MAMRECNRGKAELRYSGNNLEILAPEQYDSTSPSVPLAPKRQLGAAAEAYAQKLRTVTLYDFGAPPPALFFEDESV